MPDRDPDHWLYRLDAQQWLAAADNELAAARRAALARQQRAAVAQARRAAGMALNALLYTVPDPAYGRSYMDHLRALAQDASVPERIRQAAQALLDMPLRQELVVLGRPSAAIAEPAATIIDYVRGLMMPPVQA
ncbi:MAG: hypothetical protein RMK29_15690 [Myxococcales bacterium]|nr:hypothetical protein [Myxococcota bacterium]MDW8283158.1 hypothetical protein [Myxococcales bacterium]